KRLAALAKRAFVEWDVTTAPFVRPPNAMGAFFARIRLDANGNQVGPPTPACWKRAFDDSGTPGLPGQSAGKPVADAVWIAELVLGQTAREPARAVASCVGGQR